jgi:predicted nucleotidyltransferase
MSTTAIGDALFSKSQQKVFGLLYSKPDKTFYTNEIMRWAAMGRGTISRELEKLVAAGLLTVSRTGNQNHYQADKTSPIFNELVAIVRKTFGIADEIRRALQPYEKQIELAFIYGSISKGTDSKSSDIDLMLVGKSLNYSDIMDALLPLEETLQRTVNPTIYKKTDFVTKLKEGNSFLTRVMEQSKIMIKGVIDDFGKPGKDSPTK